MALDNHQMPHGLGAFLADADTAQIHALRNDAADRVTEYRLRIELEGATATACETLDSYETLLAQVDLEIGRRQSLARLVEAASVVAAERRAAPPVGAG